MSSITISKSILNANSHQQKAIEMVRSVRNPKLLKCNFLFENCAKCRIRFDRRSGRTNSGRCIFNQRPEARIRLPRTESPAAKRRAATLSDARPYVCVTWNLSVPTCCSGDVQRFYQIYALRTGEFLFISWAVVTTMALRPAVC
jgi:hypothetical protein